MAEPSTDTRKTDRFDLRALYETSQLLSSSLDLEFVLGNLLLTAMSKLLVTRGSAFVFDPVMDSYKVAASKGITDLKKGEYCSVSGVNKEELMTGDDVPEELAAHGIALVFPVALQHQAAPLIFIISSS